MSRHLLGKTPPSHQFEPSRPPRKRGGSWIVLALAPFALSVLFLNTAYLFKPTPAVEPTPTPAPMRSLQSIGSNSTVLANADASLPEREEEPPPVSVERCAAFKQELRTGPLFPIIPASGRTRDLDNCVPAFWDREIIALFIYKLLGILNYVAGALAVLAIIYGGVLYLTGFRSEANAKTAKSLIIGTVVGFMLVLSARLIVIGSFYLFGDPSRNSELLKLEPTSTPEER